MTRLIERRGPVEIWEVVESYGSDFYVYSSAKLIRTCPSVGMAREVAAGA